MLSDMREATPEWLTDELRRRGHLPKGDVTRVSVQALAGTSRVARLAVSYTSSAVTTPPRLLVLKLPDPKLEQRVPGRNWREVRFYQTFPSLMETLPIVRCLGADYEEGTPDRFQILLQDPEATHRAATKYSALPCRDEAEMVTDTLARLHARCWDHPALPDWLANFSASEPQTGSLSPDVESWAVLTFERFLHAVESLIPFLKKRTYRLVAERLPGRLTQRQQRRNLTLIHGDVQSSNLLYPLSDTGRTLFIDWKRAGAGPGATDMAYFLCLLLAPVQRGRWEKPLLRRYLQEIQTDGVGTYEWEDLWEDYRLGVMRQMLEALWVWSVQPNTVIWWNHLERVTQAMDDLACLELL